LWSGDGYDPKEAFGRTQHQLDTSSTHQRWLSGEIRKEILPFPAEEMTARPISKQINKPENNDPSVLEDGKMEHVGRLI
jgi:putative SOS response-associated peptidase YedK